MRKSALWSFTFKSLEWIYYIASFLILIVASSLHADIPWAREKFPESIMGLLVKVRSTAPITLITATFFMGMAKIIRSSIGTPWVWKIIHLQLDKLKEVAYKKVNIYDPVHYHRVTLFRAVGFKCLPLVKWPRKS